MLTEIRCQSHQALEYSDMGFLLSASLALLNSNALYPGEDHGTRDRLVFYGTQIQDLVRSTRVETKMSPEQVRAIMGEPHEIFGSIGVDCVYLAVGVSFGPPD